MHHEEYFFYFQWIQYFMESNIWIFGYGSLIWKPGFDYIKKENAQLNDYHRSLCVLSVEHRGTYENPGLVLGLDRGGVCEGVAFMIDSQKKKEIYDYLWEREMSRDIYLPQHLDVKIQDKFVKALTFVVNDQHEDYKGQLEWAEKEKLIMQGQGKSGHCFDYLKNTVNHLKELGIADQNLESALESIEAKR